MGVSAKESLEQARLAAADIASSKSAKEAGGKAWRIVHHATDSAFMKAVSRVLICIYFINLGALETRDGSAREDACVSLTRWL